MSSIDYVYQYGKDMNGYLNHDEFLKFMKTGIVRGDLLDNIDDCYIDKEETEDTSPVTDHWAR